MKWTISADDFHPDRVSRLSHNFHEHPMLQLDALRALAIRLSEAGTGNVKFLSPEADHNSAFWLQTESYDGRTVDEVFDSLTVPGTWIAIYEAQQDPLFREVINEVIAAGRKLLTGDQARIFDLDAYIFISSPPSLTPFHIDRENNFLLQVHGSKRISVWEPYCPEAVTDAVVEDFVLHGSLSGVNYRQGLEQHATVDSLVRAGEGVFMPSTAPHMTSTEAEDPDGPSVTIGFVSYSEATRRRANILAANALLRRLGLSPRRAGGPLDGLKYPFGYFLIRLLDRIGRWRMQRGF